MCAEASSSPLFTLKLFCQLLSVIFCWAELHIHSACAGLENSGRHSHSLNELREEHLHYQLIHSTDIAVYLKQRLHSCPLCVEMDSVSLQQLWSVTLSLTGTPPLPISTEPSSTAGVYWSAIDQKFEENGLLFAVLLSNSFSSGFSESNGLRIFPLFYRPINLPFTCQWQKVTVTLPVDAYNPGKWYHIYGVCHLTSDI